MKRFFSVLLVVLLLLSLAVPSFATVPAISALVVAGVENEPIISVPVFVKTSVSEPFVYPVYSPTSYLIQSLWDCDVELLRPIASKYKYCQLTYDSKAKKITQLALFNSSTALKLESDRFYSVATKESPICFLSSYENSASPSYVYSGSIPLYSDNNFATGFDSLKTSDIDGLCYLSSFSFKYILNEKEILYSPTISNSVLSFSKTGVIPVEPPFNPFPDLGGGDNTNGFIGDYGAKILLPRNDFKQSKLNTIATKIYYKIPYNGVMTDIKLKVSGYIGDNQSVTLHKINLLNNNTVLEGYLDVVGAVSWNKETSITVTITDYTGKSYNCAVDVTCYDDFVDVDDDGLDDRTSQDEWTGSPDFNKPFYPDNSPPEGANVIEWFKWFSNQVGQFFDTLKSGFDSTLSYGADFSKFLGSTFSYLPNEIFVIIGLGFTALVFLRIFGR